MKNREPLSEWYFHLQAILFHSEPSEVHKEDIGRKHFFGSKVFWVTLVVLCSLLHIMNLISYPAKKLCKNLCKKLCKKLCNIICSSHAQPNLREKKGLGKKWTETHLLQGNSNWRWCEKMKPIQSSFFFFFFFSLSFFLAKKYVSLSTCIIVKKYFDRNFLWLPLHTYVPDVYYVFRYLILFIVNEIIQA